MVSRMLKLKLLIVYTRLRSIKRPKVNLTINPVLLKISKSFMKLLFQISNRAGNSNLSRNSTKAPITLRFNCKFEATN